MQEKLYFIFKFAGHMSDIHNIDDDFSLLKQAVKRAGDIALDFFGSAPESKVKGDGSPVSEADIEVDRFLQNELTTVRERYGWVSEESVEDPDRCAKEIVWVVDPIDGTRAFLRHMPEWTVSAALVSAGEPVLGVVYNPVTKEFYEAVKGQGAFLNEQRIQVSDLSAQSDIRVASTIKIFDSLKNCTDLKICRVYKSSSLAYRICQLAEGKAEVVLFKSGACDWDTAAADLILREAGGVLTTFDGIPLKFNKKSVRHNSLLATNGILHSGLLKVCEKLDL